MKEIQEPLPPREWYEITGIEQEEDLEKTDKSIPSCLENCCETINNFLDKDEKQSSISESSEIIKNNIISLMQLNRKKKDLQDKLEEIILLEKRLDEEISTIEQEFNIDRYDLILHG